MNIYDKCVIRCAICDKCIGEVDYDAEIIFPKCGKCANPMPAIHENVILDTDGDKLKKPVILMH